MNIKLLEPCPDCSGKADPLCGKCLGTGVIWTEHKADIYETTPITDGGKRTGERVKIEFTRHD